MKVSLVAFFVVIASLGAVEWDREVVAFESGFFNEGATIALDNQGHARLLYIRGRLVNDWDDFIWELEDGVLRVASNASGSWVVKDVTSPEMDLFDEVFGFSSIDVDPGGTSYVAYALQEDHPLDIYLASDETGEFESRNLTSDEDRQFLPEIEIDKQGKIHLLYFEETAQDEYLVYAWVDEQGLHEKKKVNALPLWDYWCELAVSPDGMPHVFYPVLLDKPNIAHAWPEEDIMGDWKEETVTDIESYSASAVVDAGGNLHVAFSEGRHDTVWRPDFQDSVEIFFSVVDYATKKNGSWQIELIADRSGSAASVGGSFIALDVEESPHVLFHRFNVAEYDDVCYTNRSGGWVEQSITMTPRDDEYGGGLEIDNSGYAHTAYTMYDENKEQVFMCYVRSREKVAPGMEEQPARYEAFSLEVVNDGLLLTLPRASFVRMDIYDISGRRVKNFFDGTLPGGSHSFFIDPAGLAAGVYFVRAAAEEKHATGKIVITK